MKPNWPKVWLTLWYAPALAVFVTRLGGLFPDLSSHRLERTLGSASLAHPWGHDAFGRDLLLNTLNASIFSSAFAATALAGSCILAIALGTAMALAPLRVRFAASRALEIFLAFPSLLFAMAWAAIRGPGWDTLLVSLFLGTGPFLIRLVYARAREIAAEDYVLAARSMGAAPLRIAYKHLAPGVMTLCRVKAPNLFAQALLAEATLSFLGIGAPAGRDTWGSLLAQGKDYLIEAPHLAVATGIPLVLTVLSLQMLSSKRA